MKLKRSNIKAEDIEETPSFGSNISTEFILGMGKVNGSVKILLDIDKILSATELNSFQNIEKQAEKQSISTAESDK